MKKKRTKSKIQQYKIVVYPTLEKNLEVVKIYLS